MEAREEARRRQVLAYRHATRKHRIFVGSLVESFVDKATN